MSVIEVVNPANGQLLKSYPKEGASELAARFEKAKHCFDWRYSVYEYRAAALEKFARLLKDRCEEGAQIQSAETGKPVKQARGEILATLDRIDYFLDKTPSVIATQKVFDDPESATVEQIAWEPLGVIANISAWNYPYFVGVNVFVPALLTGNCVLFKPSEFCLGTGHFIGELLKEAGVPEGAFQVVSGDGETGKQLLDLSVDGVFFTGSVATGLKIAEAARTKLVPIQLELGGKDPVYICDDVPSVKIAAQSTADGAFYNCGQSCCAVERLYVHEKIYDEFVAEFVKEVASFKIGDPTDEATYLGPLTRPAQIEVLERQVNDALAKGAKVAVGGKRHERSGYFSPTVLTGVDHSMEIMREESFGPVIGIMKIDHDDIAIKLMNDTTYGLTAGVFSQSRDRAEQILKEVKAGSVYWNCCDRVSPRLPWSGRNQSGMGATLSELGIRAFTHPKAWHLRSV